MRGNFLTTRSSQGWFFGWSVGLVGWLVGRSVGLVG